MNIICTFDDNYLRHTAAMLRSLRNHHGKDEIRVWAIHSGTAGNEAGHLYAYLSTLFQHVTLSCFDSSCLNSLPVKGYLTASAYIRLAMECLLPAQIKRILYLDPDILINGNIVSLYETDLAGHAIAACLSDSQDSARERLRLPVGTPYFNSGVMLIDMDEWRCNNVLSEGIAFAKRYPERIGFADQDVLNRLFQNAWLQLDHRWNYQTKRCLDDHYKGGKQAEQVSPVIVHFSGPAHSKPWHVNCVNPYSSAFREAAKATPWARTPLTGGPPTLKIRTKHAVKQALHSLQSGFQRLRHL